MERRGGGGKGRVGGRWDRRRKKERREEGKEKERGKLPFIRSSHMQPNTTLTEILPIKHGVKIVRE